MMTIGPSDAAGNITWVQNMASYLTTTTAELYQFSNGDGAVMESHFKNDIATEGLLKNVLVKKRSCFRAVLKPLK